MNTLFMTADEVAKEMNVSKAYTVDEIIEKMGCCKQKAVKLLRELKEIGLIECERIGLTKPNRIYVKTYY